MDDQNKNLILATALSFLVILVWFVVFPPQSTTVDPETTVASTTAESGSVIPPSPTDVATAAPSVGTLEVTEVDVAKLTIDTPRLSGSISTLGGRIDDLLLKDYTDTVEPGSPLVRLLIPEGQENAYYVLYGWAPAGDLSASDVPNNETIWAIEGNDSLTHTTPVTLSWNNGNGLNFRRVISVDENYLFTIEQSVENTSNIARRLFPYGLIARHGEPDGKGFFILHEGVVRMSDGELQETKYKKMPDQDFSELERANIDSIQVEDKGWIGFTDHYWMTTLAPEAGQKFTSVAKYIAGSDIYTTETRLPVQTVQPGTTVSVSTRLFAGAKEWETIRDYELNDGIDGFVDSIDWGMFFFLTKPIFQVLHWLNGLIGNMGWSIIGLTLIIKALLLPLAYKSYVSMARMKALQPQMEKIKEKAGDDRQKLQQEIMGLYKKNKVNPASGCLPILMQIPIFFSLYKVIFVTIELRQASWIGWIQDLSAPDPSSILNLFGLLPNSPPDASSIFAILSLGVLPILLGISMWLQQKLNPAPTDATQAAVFAWMPWIFMFMLGRFASGLVLYWIANNTITFSQQYLIMRSQGINPDVFGNILKGFKRKKKDQK